MWPDSVTLLTEPLFNSWSVGLGDPATPEYVQKCVDFSGSRFVVYVRFSENLETSKSLRTTDLETELFYSSFIM